MICKDSLKDRGTAKKAKNETLDDSLFMWYSAQRERGLPISGPILAQKALSLNKKLPNSDLTFTASQGWLERWKTRHGIRQLSLTGESLSSDVAGAEKFKKEFEQFVLSEQLKPDQIYNADETGLFYRMLPSKTLASKLEDSAKGYKKSKDRLTVMVCSNASGTHKFPLVIVGKSNKPRALKNINHNSLPVVYRSQKNAWMDSFLFKNWFFDNFVPEVRKFLKENSLPEKAFLLIDNAPSHPGEKELVSGGIQVKFLPPNVTALLQPMDQGVLENIKKVYRKQLLSKIIEEEGEKSVIDFLKSINIKDVIYMVADAWDCVANSSLKKSWKKLWPAICAANEMTSDDLLQVTEDDLLQMLGTISGCSDVDREDVSEWLKDNNDGGYGAMTEEEIVAACTSRIESEEEDDVDEQGVIAPQQRTTHTDAAHQLTNIMAYLESQPDTTPAELLMIKRLRDRASFKRHTCLKQKTVDEFFKKQSTIFL